MASGSAQDATRESQGAAESLTSLPQTRAPAAAAPARRGGQRRGEMTEKMSGLTVAVRAARAVCVSGAALRVARVCE